MEKYCVESDIRVMLVRANSFPDGVLEAHQKLHSLFPYDKQRRYFGISKPSGKGKIEYKAAAEELRDGEAEKLALETFTISKGEFASVLIPDFMNNVSKIGETFQQLLQHPDLDPNGYCLEIYVNDSDVRCLVSLI